MNAALDHELDDQPPQMNGISQNDRRTRNGDGKTTHEGSPRAVPVKSCNECRQQKLRCDVVKEPFSACSRCQRLKIDCKIDSNFKRVGKRNKYAELQHEIRELRHQLAQAKAIPQTSESATGTQSFQNDGTDSLGTAQKILASDQTLEDISVSGETLTRLFDQFFTLYHPFCPVLNPKLNSNHYFALSPFLGWSVVLIGARRYPQEPDLLTKLSAPYKRLMWATVAEMPQKYHVVKALSLLCTWPLPISMHMSKMVQAGGRLGLSEMDPTFMNCGIMMHIALQTGLHRPLHSLDFIQQTREVTETEVEDRKLTWAICNIVSQGVSSSNGQPSTTIYDWSLGVGLMENGNKLSLEISNRLAIAKFCGMVTANLYINPSDVNGLVAESQQPTAIGLLKKELLDLETISIHFSAINKLYLLTAKLHLHSFAFFINRQNPQYFSMLTSLYEASASFIQGALDTDLHSNSLLQHCPAEILKGLVAAACALIKILNCSYAIHFDATQGKSIFNAAILAIGNVSLRKNDFPARVAEALARMWRAGGSGDPTVIGPYDPLDLKIRSRMSVSHVFDCFWGWRRTMNQGAPTHGQPQTGTVAALPAQMPYPTMPPLQLGFEQDGMNGISSLQDFELFNSLDWTLDENMSFDF